MKGLASTLVYPGAGVYTQIAIDRNGVCDPTAGMTFEKIATYSSAKSKIFATGLYC